MSEIPIPEDLKQQYERAQILATSGGYLRSEGTASVVLIERIATAEAEIECRNQVLLSMTTVVANLNERIAQAENALKEKERDYQTVRRLDEELQRGKLSLQAHNDTLANYVRWLREGFREIASGTNEEAKADNYVRFARDTLSGPTTSILQDYKQLADENEALRTRLSRTEKPDEAILLDESRK